MNAPAALSVIIATRDRGDRIRRTLESILANERAAFELIVVDQSVNDDTRHAVAQFRDPRLRYLYTPTAGVARGRNLGIAAAQYNWVALTDDDCLPQADWLAEIGAAFAQDARIGIVMGNILPAPHDSRAGFISNYQCRTPFLARGMRDKHRIEGAASNLALSKPMWEQLGGFDEMLGTGARFMAAEETDLILRAFLAGYWVYQTPRVCVTHTGFRSWQEGRGLIRGYMVGLTAMYVKHVKCGHYRALYPFFQLVARWAFSRPAISFEHVPSRALRLRGFMEGLRLGLATPVDRAECKFVEMEKRP